MTAPRRRFRLGAILKWTFLVGVGLYFFIPMAAMARLDMAMKL